MQDMEDGKEKESLFVRMAYREFEIESYYPDLNIGGITNLFNSAKSTFGELLKVALQKLENEFYVLSFVVILLAFAIVVLATRFAEKFPQQLGNTFVMCCFGFLGLVAVLDNIEWEKVVEEVTSR